MAYSTNTQVNSTGVDKATIIFDVTEFAAAVVMSTVSTVTDSIESKPCTIRGSQFVVKVYPSGDGGAGKGKVSVFVKNKSQHKVVAAFSIKIGDNIMSLTKDYMKEDAAWGWSDFMDRKDVGQNLRVVAVIKLLKEEGVFGKDDLKNTVEEVKEMTAEQTEEIKNELEEKMGDMERRFEECETRMKRRFEENETKMDVKIVKMESTLKAEIARARDPIKIPECPICFEELRPPLRIVQCLKGHKICEPCSEKEEVKGCPDGCRAGLMGRDHGMEAFVRQLLGEPE